MKLRLLDWNAIEHFVEIPDSTDYIIGEIISGDMVLTYPIHYDTGNSRVMNFYDGIFKILKNNFDIFNQITDSYEIFDYSEI